MERERKTKKGKRKSMNKGRRWEEDDDVIIVVTRVLDEEIFRA